MIFWRKWTVIYSFRQLFLKSSNSYVIIMAQCKLTAQDFIQSTFSPQVAVLCSSDAELLCQKNNLSFVQLVQPFCRLTTEGDSSLIFTYLILCGHFLLYCRDFAGWVVEDNFLVHIVTYACGFVFVPISLVCCVFNHLIRTFAHARYGYSLYCFI